MKRRRNLRKPKLEALRAAVGSGRKTVPGPLAPDESPSLGGQGLSPRLDDPLLDPIFPRWSPYVVAAATLVIRVTYVCQKKNWWILHPDEVYQGMEVAHSEVYGFGFRMYEYLPPPNDLHIDAENQENTLGFYGLRSFVYPHVYSLCFAVVHLFNSNLNLFLVARIFHVLVSSSLPLAVYRLSAAIYRSHDVSVLASAFVATSLHISIFGTHPLVDSFISPVFIFCLAEILTLTQNDVPVSRKDEPTVTRNVGTSEPTDQSNEDPNGGSTASGNPGGSGSEGNSSGNGESDSELPSPPAQNSTVRHTKAAVCGVIVGLLCYVSVDLILLLLLSLIGWFVLYVRGQEQRLVLCSLCRLAMGAAFAALFGGTVDYIYYGRFFLSPYQWLNFNLLAGLSERLLSTGHITEYLSNLNAVPSAVFLNLCTLCIVPVLCCSHSRRLVRFRTPVLFTGSTMAIAFLACSFHSFRETRTLHNVFVLQCMVWAGAVRAGLGVLGSGRYLPIRRISCVLVTAIAFMQIHDCYRNFPSVSDRSNKNWAFNGNWESGYVNECLDYVRQQDDVTGVFVDYTLYSIGGFSILRKDVPLIVRIEQEYQEFQTTNLPAYRKGISSRLRLVNRISDVMHVKHTKYVIGKLINSTQYNYIITQNLRKFRPLGFTAVHSCSEFKVIKSLSTNPNATAISRMRFMKGIRSSAFESDAAILEFEGSWLFTVGMYRKAVNRLRAAIDANSTRIRPFQLLSLSYGNMDMKTEAVGVEKECFKIHTFAKCMEPQSRLVLSEDYT